MKKENEKNEKNTNSINAIAQTNQEPKEVAQSKELNKNNGVIDVDNFEHIEFEDDVNYDVNDEVTFGIAETPSEEEFEKILKDDGEQFEEKQSKKLTKLSSVDILGELDLDEDEEEEERDAILRKGNGQRSLEDAEAAAILYLSTNDGAIPTTVNKETGKPARRITYDIVTGRYILMNYNDGSQRNIEQRGETLNAIMKQYFKHPRITVDKAFLNTAVNNIPAYISVFEPNKKEFYKSSDGFDQFQNKFTEEGTLLGLRDKNKDNRLQSLDFILKYPFINVLFENLTASDKINKNYLLNWLSAAMQTRKKNLCGVILSGGQGAGKGVLNEQILGKVYGKYLGNMSNEELNSTFNSGLDTKMFLVLNEIKTSFTDSRVSAKVKELVTDSHLNINTKGVAMYESQNHFNVLMNTNEATPLRLEESDRRWTIIKTGGKLKFVFKELGYSENDFIKGIQEEAEDFIYDMMHYNYDISEARSVLSNEAKDNIIETTSTRIEVLARKMIAKDYEFLDGKIEEAIEDNQFSLPPAFKSSLFDEIKNNYVSNNSLILMYRAFIDSEEKSSNKIGNKWQVYLGKSTIRSKNGRARSLTDNVVDTSSLKASFEKQEDEIEDAIASEVSNETLSYKREETISSKGFFKICKALSKAQDTKYLAIRLDSNRNEYNIIANDTKYSSDASVFTPEMIKLVQMISIPF